MSWKPVVVGVDDSTESGSALALAWNVARQAEAACRPIHVARELASVPAEFDRDEAQSKAAAAARKMVAAALGGSAPPEALERIEVRTGNTAWVLGAAVREYGAELLVLGGKHHAAPVRWFSSSTVHHAVRTIDVPVLVAADYSGSIGRVLAAADLSDAAGPTLAAAARFAGLFGAELRALHVVEPFPPIPDVAVQLDEQEHIRSAEQEFAQVVGGGAAGYAAQHIVRCGTPSRTICDEAAGWDADLVVVGSHGKGWVDRVLLGSTAERLLNRLPISVLVVPVGGDRAGRESAR
jgi:nucleotide-binding universal stress UspA family protein